MWLRRGRLRFHLFLFLFSTVHVSAQTWSVRNFDVSDGLGHSTVFRVSPSPDSLCIWFGTDQGLSRFDGSDWENFALPGKVYSSHILAIDAISSDRVEFSAFKEGWFEWHEGEVRTKERRGPGGALTQVLSVFRDAAGRDWMIDGKQGLVYFEAGEGMAHAFKQDDTIYRFSKNAASIGEFNGKVLFPHDHGILAYENGAFHSFLDSANVLQTVVQDGKLWIATASRLMRLEEDGLREVLEVDNVREVFVDHRNRLWVAADQGLLVLADDTISNLTDELGLAGALVNQIAEDYAGNIWLATYGSGVYALHQNPVVEQVHIVEKTAHFFRTLYRSSQGEVFVGSMGSAGLLKQDTLLPLLGRSELDGLVCHFHEQDDGSIFIGAAHASYVFGDGELRETSYGNVLSYARHPELGTFFGGYRGLKLPNGEDTRDEAPQVANIRAIAFWDESVLFGTRSGLWTMENDRLVKWSQSGLLADVEVHDLLSEGDTFLVAATSEGIFGYRNGAWTHHSTSTGAFHPAYCLERMPNGRLWAGTQNGLFSLREDGVLESFPSLEAHGSKVVYSLLALDTNHLLYGSLNHLARINLGMDSPISHPPRIKIEQAKFNDQQMSSGGFELSPGKHPLIIRFKAIDFSDHGEFNYEFELLRDGQLYASEKDVSNTLLFHQLEPGKYLLTLRLMNQESEAAQLRFTIQDYWWQSPWVIVLALILLILFGLLSYKLGSLIRHRLQTSKRKRLLQIVDLRHKALNAMMNPHFIFNALNSIQHYISKNQQAKSVRYSEDFAQLIRMNLEQAQCAQVPISEEIERLELYCSLEQLRFETPFELIVEAEEDVDLEDLEIPPLMLQPFVENAIIHGILPQQEKGMIRLAFSMKTETMLQVVITDNGVGINADQQRTSSHNSLAIQLIKERLSLQKGAMDLEIEDLSQQRADAHGTRVRFCLNV